MNDARTGRLLLGEDGRTSVRPYKDGRSMLRPYKEGEGYFKAVIRGACLRKCAKALAWALEPGLGLSTQSIYCCTAPWRQTRAMT